MTVSNWFLPIHTSNQLVLILLPIILGVAFPDMALLRIGQPEGDRVINPNRNLKGHNFFYFPISVACYIRKKSAVWAALLVFPKVVIKWWQ